MKVAFGLLFITNCSTTFAQKDKETCLAGNCRNGFGLKRIENAFASPFYQNYYLMGEFKNGRLNGKGCRFNKKIMYSNVSKKGWNSQRDNKVMEGEIIELCKAGKLAGPDSLSMQWYETGEFVNNLLQGKGYAVLYDGYYKYQKAVCERQGGFYQGKLYGKGIKMYSYGDYAFDTISNQLTGKPIRMNVIISGNFIYDVGAGNDVCDSCTLSVMSRSGVWGNMTGGYLTDDFFSGWVIRDYEDVLRTRQGNVAYLQRPGNVFKKTTPVKILYIAGEPVSPAYPAETLSNTKSLDIGNNTSYTGEVDTQGNAFGFGTISSPEYSYTGFVNHNQPDGWGIYRAKNQFVVTPYLAGQFSDGEMESGTSFDRAGMKIITCKGNNPDWKFGHTRFNMFTGKVQHGYFEERNYSYDAKLNIYKLVQSKTGVMVDGVEKENYVSVGRTDDDIRRQRKVVNGKIDYSDIVKGDVIVIDGLASLVTRAGYSNIELLDGRKLYSGSITTVQLSKHAVGEFQHTCAACNGSPVKKVTYTPPPQQVTATVYTRETVVGDYVILTHDVPSLITYTKTFSPFTRTEFCNVCNGTGIINIARQIHE